MVCDSLRSWAKKWETALFIVDNVYKSKNWLMIKSLSYPDMLLSTCKPFKPSYSFKN